MFDDLRQRQQTDLFLRTKVYSKENVRIYLLYRWEKLKGKVTQAASYQDWFVVAEEKALIDVMASRYEISIDTSVVNERFRDYVLQQYGKISQNLDANSPVLVSKVMEYINDRSNKYVLIVMDGMSEFDWNIIAESFNGIHYEKTSVMAMIPTTTSVSRQCLLSNKYPSQLVNPWTLSKEKQEFVDCALEFGFSDNQIGYERGYEASFGSFVRCGAIIINDVDDLVHAQQQGRVGMYNDIAVLSKQGKLVELT